MGQKKRCSGNRFLLKQEAGADVEADIMSVRSPERANVVPESNGVTTI